MLLEIEPQIEASIVEAPSEQQAPSEVQPKKRMRKALSSSLLIQIANQCGAEAAQKACDANEPEIVACALKQLAKKDALLAKTLGFVEAEKQRVSNVATINRANAAIVNVACLGLKGGDKVSIDRSVEGAVTLRVA